MRVHTGKNIRIIAFLVLVIACLGISYAAFSSTLNIKSKLYISPDSSVLRVKLSSTASGINLDDIEPTSVSPSNLDYLKAKLDNDGIPTISNMGVTFTGANQYITYEFYTANIGDTDAYLTDIVYNNYDDSENFKVCLPTSGGDPLDAERACSAISVKVSIDGNDYTGTSSLNNKLESGESKKVSVTISYDSEGYVPDEPFTVYFGKIMFIYSSLEGGNSFVGNPSCFGVEAVTDENTGETYGVITGYDVSCGTSVTIPSRAPITQTILGEFNNSKCTNLFGSFGIYTQEEILERCASSKTIYDNDETENEGYNGIVGMFVDKNYVETSEEIDITEIGEGAFSFLFNLTSVTIGNNITKIDNSAFMYNSISTLDLSGASNLDTIGEDAFRNNQLASVTLPSSVTTIGEFAFDQNQLTSVTLPSSVTSIGDYAFCDNSNLTSLIIEGPSRTQNLSFGSAPFCDTLTSITINTNPNYLSLTNSKLGWYHSGDACYMSTDGDPTTSSCITINNN